MIITICGSTRFKNEIMEAAKNLTLDDHIVLMPTIFEHADNVELTQEQKIRLDNLHKMKINMSDAVFVVNVDGYIGESTYGEIDWAVRNKKELYFLINPNPDAPTEETEQVAGEVDGENVTIPTGEPAND